MKVVALQAAFYNGNRVRPGAEVEVADGYKGSWFAAVDGPAAKAAKAAKSKPAKAEPKALSELGGEGTKSFTAVHEAKADLA